MRARGGIAALLALVCLSVPVPAHGAERPVLIRGVGAAHGFGLAMDGVQGQARAGWSYDRILDLFYPGTEPGTAAGTVRVGLAHGDVASLVVPSGGMISSAPPSADGQRRTLPSGARVELRVDGGGIAGADLPAVVEAPAEARARQEPPSLLPPVLPTPTPAPPDRDGGGGEGSHDEPASGDVGTGPRSVWVWGAGDPALVAVEQTGRRYRGAIEVKPHPSEGGLVIVNHVDLETYVGGIAEEKGQGWPAAGLETLAVAARSLAAATMSWYHKNRVHGYDICPDGNCQLYLGYDGEEPAMWAAVRKTAGEIRTYGGRPILAMYHGNGGGQTESYRAAIGGGADPHPYLDSVKYPHAAPSRWEVTTTLDEVAAKLQGRGVAIPGRLRGVEVTARGESPRVLRVRLDGTQGTSEIGGGTFALALELRSTWFEVDPQEPAPRRSSASVSVRRAGQGTLGLGGLGGGDDAEAPAGAWGASGLGAGAVALLGAAAALRRRERR